MRTVDTFVAWCVRTAAARWPRDVSDELAAEWSAELHAIRRDTSVAAWRRQWQRLYFVVSLVALPPYRDRQQGSFFMPRLSVMGRRCVMLIAVGALCAIVQATPGMVRRAPLSGITAEIMSTLAAVLSAIALGALGYWLGARRPVRVNPTSRFDHLAAAAIAVVCVGGAVAVLLARYGDGTVIEWLMYPVWMVTFIPLLIHVMRLASKGRKLAAWFWGIGGGLVLCDLVTIPLGIGYAIHNGAAVASVDLTDAPLWFIQAFSSDYGAWFAQSFQGATDPQVLAAIGLSTVLPALLPATAFLMTYLARSAQAPWPVVSHLRPADTNTASGTPPLRQYAGLSTCALAIVGWSAIVAFLTPIADQVGHDAPAAWVRELRQAAILLATLALAWALLGRAGVLLPGVGLAVGLLAVDITADRWDPAGTGAFLLLAGTGGALLVGSWWLATTLDKMAPDAATRRNGLVGLAIVTAYCAPAVQWQANALTGGYESEGFASPAALPVTTTVLMLMLIVVAMSAANAARNRPLSPRGFAATMTVPVMLLIGSGILTWTGIPAIPDGTGALLGLPLAVYTLAVITWESTPSLGRVLKWTALALAGLPAGVILAYLEGVLSEIIGASLLSLRGPYGPELIVGSPVVLVGVLPLAAIGAIVVARRMESRAGSSATA